MKDTKIENKIIVYERLNFITLCLSLLNLFFSRKQYFINYSLFLKKFFFSFIKKTGLKQIHNIDFLSQSIYPKSSEMCIKMGNKIVNDNPDLAKPLIQFLDDSRAESLIKQVFVHSLSEDTYKYIILKEFVTQNKETLIFYFPTSKSFINKEIKKNLQNLIVIKWHLPILNVTKSINNCLSFIGLGILPFYLICRFLCKGKISFIRTSPQIKKKVIYFHNSDILIKDPSLTYRYMYFFHSGILKISDSIHTTCLQKKSLSTNKINYIERKGGHTLDFHKQKIRIFHILKRIFIDYLKTFFVYFLSLSFSPSSSFRTFKHISGIINRIVEFESLLEKVAPKFAFFESEIGFDPSIFTIIANKQDIYTMNMLHGIGGYCFSDYNRSNSIINYYLVPGNYYMKYLQPINPNVDGFYPVGNQEIEEISSSTRDKNKLSHLKKDNQRIISILVNFYWPFFPENQKVGPIFDEEKARNAFFDYWLSFFEWAGQQKDTFFIFKGKSLVHQYEHPYLQEIMCKIPLEKYCQDDNLLLNDVIAVSDCSISNDSSSVFYNSLCLGVPSISYDTVMKGYTEVDGYDKHLVAYTPDKLLKNLTYLLENGLPKYTFENVRKDHHAEGKLDMKTPFRITKIIEELLE